MPNYVAKARSNYFRVKDDEAFARWVATLPGVRTMEHENAEGSLCLLADDADTGSWPTTRFDEETFEEDGDLHLYAELSEHLAEGEVAVLQEVGSFNWASLNGFAVAVNHDGDTIEVSIDDVYDKVRQAGWSENVGEAVN